MTFEYNTTLEQQILYNLDGWTITDTTTPVQTYTDDINIEELNTTKRISSLEVEVFYYKTINLVTSYIGQNLENFTQETDTNILLECICLWTAGLLWRKYNLKIIDQSDETQTLGYGDELIIKAKSTLKPFMYRKLVVW